MGFPTEAGPMQGRPLSPVLATLACPGLEAPIPQRGPRSGSRGFQSPHVVGYADDLVLLPEDSTVGQGCQDAVPTGRHTMGGTLQPSQTRIPPTLALGPEKPGCDVPGFHSQQYPAGHTTSGKDWGGRLHGFPTPIPPRPPAIQSQVDALRKTLARHKHAAPARLIQALNPQRRGWSPSYAPVRSARLCQTLAHTLDGMRGGWAVPRHPNPAKPRIARHYWRIDDGQGWPFQPSNSRTRLRRPALPATPALRERARNTESGCRRLGLLEYTIGPPS